MRRSPLLDTSSVRHRRRDHNDIWRITDGDGTALEESDEFFLTITAALAGGRCRLAVREQRDAARLLQRITHAERGVRLEGPG